MQNESLLCELSGRGSSAILSRNDGLGASCTMTGDGGAGMSGELGVTGVASFFFLLKKPMMNTVKLVVRSKRSTLIRVVFQEQPKLADEQKM